MPKVHFSTLASNDLIENAEFIAGDKPDAAFRWVDRIEEVCGLLARNPDLGEARETHQHGRCRSFVVGNYVIFFRRASDGVEIIRIIRADRDIESL